MKAIHNRDKVKTEIVYQLQKKPSLAAWLSANINYRQSITIF
jgi:hypothetical protein